MFAIIDIETCGGKFELKKGAIIDICILIHDGLQVVDKFSTLVNPQCHISSFYTRLSGITNEMVEDAPTFAMIAKKVLEMTEGQIFVAHNVGFDYGFVKAEFASLGYKYKREKLCTVRLARKILPKRISYSLGNLCASLGIEIEGRHRAEGDVVATNHITDSERLKDQSIILDQNSYIEELCERHKIKVLRSFNDVCSEDVSKREQWNRLIGYIESSNVPIDYILIRGRDTLSPDIRVSLKLKKELYNNYGIEIISTGKPIDLKIIPDMKTRRLVKKTNIVQYIRIIKDEQVEYKSVRDELSDYTNIAYQKRALNSYCNSFCYCAVREFIDFSIKDSDDKPEFDNLILFLEQNNNINKLFISRWDRLSSDIQEVNFIIDKLKKIDVEVYAILQPLHFGFPEAKTILASYLNDHKTKYKTR